MEGTQADHLSQSIDREASLFERKSDLRDFLERAVRSVTESGAAVACGIYVRDRPSGGLTLRAASGRAADLPQSPDAGDAFSTAFRERRPLRVPLPDGMVRLVLPVTRGPNGLGVLVVDRRGEPAGNEETELRNVASRLGSVLENATILLESRPEGGAEPKARAIEGETAAAGVAEGTALPFDALSATDVEPIEGDGSGGNDVERFNRALDQTRRQIEGMVNDTASQLADVVGLIFSAHLLMLNDDAFTGAMRRLVEAGRSPEAGVNEVVAHYVSLFEGMSETRLAEKAHDVRDLGYRLLRNLSGSDSESRDYQGRIVLASHVYPSDLVRLAAQRAEGVVLLGAAVTAHVAILARSLSLPAMITHDRAILDIPAGTSLRLDATTGRLHVDVAPQRAAPAARARETWAAGPGESARVTATRDGARVSVLANVNLFKDAQLAAAQGADGIGLYRSEFLFIIRNDFLSEEEQHSTYRRIVDAMPGREVSLRTADIGGDKLMEGRREQESNPFLGVRGIRFSLANKVLFREQLRAMLRAGAGRDLGILLPMVSSVEEIEEAREELDRCLGELDAQGQEHNPRPRFGAMVELPSAMMAVEDLAAATDFLSVGTNDLIMYLLAVDRTNERLSRLYRSHHPTVLRSLAQVARGAGARLADLSVCGDSAADRLMVPFLVGIGVRKLSVAPQRMAEVRAVVAGLTVGECETIAKEMLAIRTIREMDGYLRDLRERLDGGAGVRGATSGQLLSAPDSAIPT